MQMFQNNAQYVHAMKKSDETDVVGNRVIAKDNSNSSTSPWVIVFPTMSCLTIPANDSPSQRANQNTIAIQ
jgi:hypothetical protein